MKSSAAISAHDISHDGAASKRVTTCSSTAKRTLINTLFYKKHYTIHFRKSCFLAEIWVFNKNTQEHNLSKI